MARARFRVLTALATALTVWSAGCLELATVPGADPLAAAPARADRLWRPPDPPVASLDDLPAPNRGLGKRHAGAAALELADLIDIALERNPHTRRAWEDARVAAARVGKATAPYYPRLRTNAEWGPERFEDRTEPSATTVHQNFSVPSVELSWTLIDFGRRSSALETARQQLMATGLFFNRKIQEVVFRTQTAFFLFDAARSRVTAAEENLELARTVREAADDRLAAGLATEPAALLARQAEAKAAYELEDARAKVSDARARLAVALGIPANTRFEVVSLGSVPLPPKLSQSVDTLIDTAVRQRPDLSARVAEVRAREAAIESARADLYPEVGFLGSYGVDLSRFSANGAPTERVDSPDYAALLGVKWTIFEGFERLNTIREREAEAASARAALASAEIDVIAVAWRAYDDFLTARKKLDFAEALLRASQDAYAANVETYRNGLSTITELLEAETDLASARYTVVDTRAQLLLASSALAYATGAVDTK